ncbi:MAG: hypothetical protein OXC09_11585 [Truepera sp.]|nr:hypothetical protein [Truepera sp.]
MAWTVRILAACLVWICLAATQAQNYEVVGERDSSFGLRSRITLEVEIPSLVQPAQQTGDLSGVMREMVRTMMAAAVWRHRLSWPDVVSVRLWHSYESGRYNALSRLVYAPDGCGWVGKDCTGDLWTEFRYCSSYSRDHDLFHDCHSHPVPEDLREWGRPGQDLQTQRPGRPVPTNSLAEQMIDMVAPGQYGAGVANRLGEIFPRLVRFCPDLTGEAEAAAMVSSVYMLLESVGRREEVVGLAQRLLDIAGTTATMATAGSVPRSDCANLYGVYYLFRFEDDLRPEEAYAATMELVATGIGVMWE